MAPPFGAQATSSCQEKRASRVPASTVVMRNAETESSMNDSAMRLPVSGASPTFSNSVTQKPAIVEANICTGSMPCTAVT